MRYSGIGGQAVMEGVMMKNGNKYAVAVRNPDKEIVIESSEYGGIGKNKKLKNMPVFRGVFNFIESLSLGFKPLTYSDYVLEEEDKEGKKDPKSKKKDDLVMGITVTASVVLAIAIFMALPYGISLLFRKAVSSQWVLALLEGALRLLIFLCYVGGISLMPDIKRVYMYHGAEHKCINCIESGRELTVENVRESSRLHKRCGTSFLLIVMFVSILFFMFIRVDSGILRLALRLLLIPVIAGVSYEFIRLAGRSDHFLVNLISKPGLMLQKITTREPEDDMIEVGIASVEAVFDWKAYIKEINDSALERR